MSEAAWTTFNADQFRIFLPNCI